jgi:hypothetical protein
VTESEAFHIDEPVRDEQSGVYMTIKRPNGEIIRYSHPSQYLRGWVTEAGIRRSCLAPIPGSFSYNELKRTDLTVKS